MATDNEYLSLFVLRYLGKKVLKFCYCFKTYLKDNPFLAHVIKVSKYVFDLSFSKICEPRGIMSSLWNVVFLKSA